MSTSISTSSSTDTINVFDFAAIRLPPDFEREAGVRKQLTTLRVRKPRPQEWIRVHPDPEYRIEVATLVFKENDDAEQDTYLVHPTVAAELGDSEITYQTIYLTVNRQGVPFLWACRHPRENSRSGDLAATSRLEAAEAAMTRSVRVQWRSPAFEMSFRDDNFVEAEPKWPDKPFSELVQIAFDKPGLFIGSMDHPVVKILLGEGVMYSPYKHVIACDFEFEFGGVEGNKPRPVCMVAKDLVSGKEWRVWRGEFGAAPPFPIGSDSLFVAYYASAEIGCFLALGWKPPEIVLDLFTEFRARTNGTDWLEGRGLLAALHYFNIDGIGALEKQGMRDLILRGPPWSSKDTADILDYCAGDVYALERLLPRMWPEIDLPRALQRGRYMKAAAHMEFAGIPIDVDTLQDLRNNWDKIKVQLIADVDRDYGVFDGTTFKATLFEDYLIKNAIPWPRLPSGRLALDRDTFKEMGRAYPIISPLRELRHALSEMRLNALQVGDDGRNRCLLGTFGTKTGRNAPSNTKFIFGPSVWLRSLIKPEPGRALAYIDWSAQEVGIAAAVSGDPVMMADYQSGDPYVAFGIGAGMLPPGATKKSHGPQRDAIKACVLGLQYGMGEETLAERIGKPRIVAREMIRAHQQRYRKFWDMVDSVISIAMDCRPVHTVGGWPLQASSDPSPNSVMNFPMQANGAEMLRLACCMATERGIEVHAPVHDAVLIGSSIEDIDRVIASMRQIMEDAARAVLGGFDIPTGKPDVVRYPDRFEDDRGKVMWKRVMHLLREVAHV